MRMAWWRVVGRFARVSLRQTRKQCTVTGRDRMGETRGAVDSDDAALAWLWEKITT